MSFSGGGYFPDMSKKRGETMPSRPVKQGIYTVLKSGKINPSIRGYRKLQKYLQAIERDLVRDLGGEENLTTAKEILVKSRHTASFSWQGHTRSDIRSWSLRRPGGGSSRAATGPGPSVYRVSKRGPAEPSRPGPGPAQGRGRPDHPGRRPGI